MINRRKFALGSSLILALGGLALLFYPGQSKRPNRVDRVPMTVKRAKVDEIKFHQGRKVMGSSSEQVLKDIDKLQTVNVISDHWEEGVEQAIRVQGGEELKDIKISKLDSFIWIQQGIALNVESVLIALTNQKDEVTKFRAMVDSHSGKILQTWDHPIIDPVNPREGFGIKVDPRYHND